MKFLLAALACAVLSISAFAQDAPRVEVFGGYSLLRVEGVNFNGFNGSLAVNPTSSFGLVADVGAHYGPLDSSLYTLTGGPQFNLRRSRATLFVRGLAGAARLGSLGDGVTAFAFGGGGGLDVKVAKGVSIRAGQVDYFGFRTQGVTANSFRFSTGVVFGF